MADSLFGLATQIFGVLAGILALGTLLAWIRGWGIRFAMVGYTAFALVLTAGSFALTLTPIMQTSIPGAARYTTVYDQGSNQAVIVVAPTIDPETLELTLRQAARNLASSGRFSTGSRLFTLRARTVVHPEPGISRPLYLGQLQQTLGQREDPNLQIQIDPSGFEELQQYLPADQ